MKYKIILEIIENIKSNPKLAKKLKFFGLAGLIGFIMIGGIAIWALISTINYVASSANQVVQSPVAKVHVENLKSEIKNLPQINTASCWDKATSLLTVNAWMEESVDENLTQLMAACFEKKHTECSGVECERAS